jgi:hypothetical protein
MGRLVGTFKVLMASIWVGIVYGALAGAAFGTCIMPVFGTIGGCFVGAMLGILFGLLGGGLGGPWGWAASGLIVGGLGTTSEFPGFGVFPALLLAVVGWFFGRTLRTGRPRLPLARWYSNLIIDSYLVYPRHFVRLVVLWLSLTGGAYLLYQHLSDFEVSDHETWEFDD